MPVTTSGAEEEYFKRQEFVKKQKAEIAKSEQMANDEKIRLQELHYMHCPKCGMELIEIDYKGIAVDKCSNCAGIWLDAGELEQISKFEKTAMDKWFTVFKK